MRPRCHPDRLRRQPARNKWERTINQPLATRSGAHRLGSCTIPCCCRAGKRKQLEFRGRVSHTTPTPPPLLPRDCRLGSGPPAGLGHIIGGTEARGREVVAALDVEANVAVGPDAAQEKADAAKAADLLLIIL